MQLLVKLFCTICKLQLSLCLQRHGRHMLPVHFPEGRLSSAKDVCEMCHILNWLLYVTIPLEVMKACNFIDFSGGECCQGWRARGATGSSPPGDEVGWQAVSVVCSDKEDGDPCSGSTRIYLSLSTQCLEGQVLVGKMLLLPPWNQHLCLIWGILKYAFTLIQLFQTLHLESRLHLLLLWKVWMTLPCWAASGQP